MPRDVDDDGECERSEVLMASRGRRWVSTSVAGELSFGAERS